jgi:hypothetical protein
MCSALQIKADKNKQEDQMKTKDSFNYVYVLEMYTGVKHLLNYDKRHKKAMTYDEMLTLNIFNDSASAIEFLNTVDTKELVKDLNNRPKNIWGFKGLDTKRIVYVIYKVPVGLYNRPFSPKLYGYNIDYTLKQCKEDFMMFMYNEDGAFSMLDIETDTDGRVIYGRCGTDFAFDEDNKIIYSEAEKSDIENTKEEKEGAIEIV